MSFSSSWFKGSLQMGASLLIYWTIEPIVAAPCIFSWRTRLKQRVDKGWMFNVFNLLKVFLQIEKKLSSESHHWISIRIDRNHLIVSNEHSGQKTSMQFTGGFHLSSNTSKRSIVGLRDRSTAGRFILLCANVQLMRSAWRCRLLQTKNRDHMGYTKSPSSRIKRNMG